MDIRLNRYYTLTELADLLHVSKQTLYRRNNTGESMPAAREVLGALRYKGKDIIAWMDAHPVINRDTRQRRVP